MYKNEDKRREASKERMRKMRSKDVTPKENVTPIDQNVTPDVTPYQDDVVPESMAYPTDHPDTIQCGAITYQYKDAPKWLHGGGDRVGGMDGGAESGSLPFDTNIILKGG